MRSCHTLVHSIAKSLAHVVVQADVLSKPPVKSGEGNMWISVHNI